MNKALRTVQNAFADYINRRVDNEIKWAKLRHSYFVTYDYKVEKVDNIATKFAEEVERLAKEDPAVNRE